MLANLLLKSRSGAAVTDPEYARFLKEAGTGNFSSETDLMSGLAKMKKNLIDINKNIGLKYGKDVLAEYQNRTGLKLKIPSDNSNENVTSNIVTIQGPSGQTVKMAKDKAEKYLSKPGYKLVGQ
jgi:hypothetical protein